ncbi:YbaK/EbsC family protein [Alcaligenaceae bacterium]|nr:YbaK/EbsC family protein [Alcaligenaceae bacterium]
MSLASVQQFFAEHAPELSIIETNAPTPTVSSAAETHGVAPGQIAKTLSMRCGDLTFLVVTRGDSRLDNKKLKQVFGGKVKMLDADSVLSLTGHPVGGVCPFGLATPLPVYCDLSLQDFDTVLPAAGSVNSAVRITPKHLAQLVDAQWIDVTETANEPA